jgi:uncharacterized metal-binding protein YceD (DUF177 family)
MVFSMLSTNVDWPDTKDVTHYCAACNSKVALKLHTETEATPYSPDTATAEAVKK